MSIDGALTTTLDELGVHFIAGQTDGRAAANVPPQILLCGLTSSDEARLRLALIPLFLERPQYADYVTEALNHLSPTQQQLLCCYYTAARLLQQKYRSQLTFLIGKRPPLPALFDDVLDINTIELPDARLRQLAERQAQLSGKPLNWYGTYEHAYQRLARSARWRKQ